MSDEDLEPVVLAHIEDGEVVGISRDGGDSWTTQSISSLSCDPEPLVQLSDVIAFLDMQRKQQMVGDHEVSFDIQEWEEMVDQLRDITQNGDTE